MFVLISQSTLLNKYHKKIKFIILLIDNAFISFFLFSVYVFPLGFALLFFDLLVFLCLFFPCRPYLSLLTFQILLTMHLNFITYSLNNSSCKDAKPQSLKSLGLLINFKIMYQKSVFRDNIRKYKFLGVLAALREIL